MASTNFISAVLRKGTQVLRQIGKVKTQNAPPVKVAETKSQQPVQFAYARYREQTSRLHGIWERIVPKVYYETLASQLGRQVFLRGRRNIPLLAFTGIVLAQNVDKTDDEISARLQEFVKTTQAVTEHEDSPLLRKIKCLNLDMFQIGDSIGQGCNAAVYEAKFLEEDNQEINAPSDAKLEQCEVAETVEDIPEEIDVSDDVSDAGSDFTILCPSEDELDSEDEAPRTFTVAPEMEFSFSNDTDVEWETDSDISVLDYAREEESDMGMAESSYLMSISVTDLVMKDVEDAGGTQQMDEEEYSPLNSHVSEEGTKQSENQRFDLAIKMMFNYDIESNTEAILRAMDNEAVPARLLESHTHGHTWQNWHRSRKKRLPPHPNIVEMLGVFVDPTPRLPGCEVNYPAALPTRHHQEGLGRNMTMFLVMKKYSMTLSEYLAISHLSIWERLYLLTQLLEAVDHMGRHGIAHRDMKANNVLLDTSREGPPQLVLSDFGCCLADPAWGLKIPYPTDMIDRGGNTALMAPEISTASPGRFAVLDYTRSDLWGAGALAYEILGGDNPFYASNAGRLDSRTYQETDLPPLPDEVPDTVKRLVHSMLKRDPSKRPTPRLAADILHFLLWSPRSWGSEVNIRRSDVIWWQVNMITELRLQRNYGNDDSAIFNLKQCFLWNFNMNRFSDVLSFFGYNFIEYYLTLH